MSFKIGEPLKKLPIKRSARSKLYIDIIEAVASKSKAYYPIEVKGRKPMTIYIALTKKVKGRTDLRTHFVGGVVYLEKL